MNVFDEVERPKDRPVLKGRWVDINKGDDSRPNYRSRYVGKEIKRGAEGSLVANTLRQCGFCPRSNCF
jgi:hypothetical protein